MLKKFIFVIAILFAFVLMAQNSPTMKEQATGIKNTIVEIDTLKSSGKTGTTGTSGIINKVQKSY
jgi:hypothetical protein